MKVARTLHRREPILTLLILLFAFLSNFVLAGTLDDSDWFRPEMALFCGSAWPWVSIPDAARALPGMPDQVPE